MRTDTGMAIMFSWYHEEYTTHCLEVQGSEFRLRLGLRLGLESWLQYAPETVVIVIGAMHSWVNEAKE